MPDTPARSRHTRGLDDQEFSAPRPETPLPAHPGDVGWVEAMDYVAAAAKWLMEQCMNKTALTPPEALARKIEAQNIADLQRTIERMTKFRKNHAAEQATQKSDDELASELLEGINKISNA